MITFTQDEMVRRILAKGSKAAKLEILDEIARRPDSAQFHDEVLLVASSTSSRELWTKARVVMWGINCLTAVGIEKRGLRA